MKTKMLIKNQGGGAAVEFALILPLFIFLLFGIIEGGLLLYNEQVITNASREGARAGIVAGLDRNNNQHIAQSQTTATNFCSNYLVTFSNNINPLSITSTSTGILFGDDLSVNVTYVYDFLVLFNPITFSRFNPIPLRAQTVMKME